MVIKWSVLELVTRMPEEKPVEKVPSPLLEPRGFKMTEEEERELADLMDED